jgi:hypothetical protein
MNRWHWVASNFILCLAFPNVPSLHGQDLEKPSNEMILVSKVRAIIEAKCAKCHGEQVEKPDGDFGYVRDLKRVSNNLSYVVRKDPAESHFFVLIRDGEMPPADNDIAPMSAEEKQVIRQWIVQGAPHRLPKDWAEIAATQKLAVPKSNAPEPPKYTSVLPQDVAKIEITIDAIDTHAKELFARIAEQAKVKIDFQQGTSDPKLSIRLTKGTLDEALKYLCLNGNLILKWQDKSIVITSGKESLHRRKTETER